MPEIYTPEPFMLPVSHITRISMFGEAGKMSEDWRRARLSKFTASEQSALMGEKPDTIGALNYIRRKVGEDLSGLPCRDEVDTVATEHGKRYEEDGIVAVGKYLKIDFVITQKLISEPGSKHGATPDFLIRHKESPDGKFWKVSTGEIKCPPSYDKFIELFCCNTPEDLKKVNKAYYWQKLKQMKVANALVGYFGIYHPFFIESTPLNIIVFRRIDLRDDFKLLDDRDKFAVVKFNEIREQMITKKLPQPINIQIG